MFAGYLSELLFQTSSVTGESIFCLFFLAVLAGATSSFDLGACGF